MEDETKPSAGEEDSKKGFELAGQQTEFQRLARIQRLAKKHPMLAATMVDLEACADIFKKAVVKKAAEDVTREGPPPVPPIEPFKRASTCPAMWEDMSGADRFRLCSQCKLYMYDFTGMTPDEAKAMAYKREGMEGEIKFYKRIDKRYLTQDCPVGIQIRKTRIKVAALGTVLFCGLVALSAGWHAMNSQTSGSIGSTDNHSGSTPGFSLTPSHQSNYHPAPQAQISNNQQQAETANTNQTNTQSQGDAKPLPIPQKDGHPIGIDGKPIPEGAKFVTRFTRLEFVRGAPRTVVNIPIKDDSQSGNNAQAAANNRK
jgi:hypothetical protein